MKKKLICMLLCVHMSSLLFSGCKKEEAAETPAAQEEAAETATPEVTAEPAIDVSTLTPEEHLKYVFSRYSNQGQRGYTVYRGQNWDTVELDETVQIDTINQKIYVEKATGEKYFLTSESSIDYVYIPTEETADGYVKISGHPSLVYTNYSLPLFTPMSTAEYEIIDLSIDVDEAYQDQNGLTVQDLNVFYTKQFTTADGLVVETDVMDIVTVNAETQNMVRRLIEIEDIADDTSEYNSVEEYYFTTGEDAAILSSALPSYSTSIAAIPYDEYSKQ